jgi:hypothetical protein
MAENAHRISSLETGVVALRRSLAPGLEQAADAARIRASVSCDPPAISKGPPLSDHAARSRNPRGPAERALRNLSGAFYGNASDRSLPRDRQGSRASPCKMQPPLGHGQGPPRGAFEGGGIPGRSGSKFAAVRRDDGYLRRGRLCPGITDLFVTEMVVATVSNEIFYDGDGQPTGITEQPISFGCDRNEDAVKEISEALTLAP